MQPLALHEFHFSLGARFTELNGAEMVNDYGDWLAEHATLRQSVGVLDLSFRSRICLTGADRVRFLHGQVTNDVKKLRAGEGCYATITTNKGKMESDLNIFCLADELLLDFEPGLSERITQRMERFIVADDVQVVDVAPHYGLLSVQGPRAEEVIQSLGWSERLSRSAEIPREPLNSIKFSDTTLGEIYLMKHARLLKLCSRGRESAHSKNESLSRLTSAATDKIISGFDLFIPRSSLGAVADKLIAAAKQIGGQVCGWQAFETARIEAGIPRFGVDMDETNLPLECGISDRAISYKKGCYIGQEVINRIHSFGHVTKELRGLRLAHDLKPLPQRVDKLFRDGKEIGYVTSAVKSPMLGNIALGYVRREANQIGTELVLHAAAGKSKAKIVEIPFTREPG
jgi:folate-binding protein YgfZ